MDGTTVEAGATQARKVDRRVARTRRLLRDALIGLMKTTPWDRISVQQICDRADVARSSFYAHFNNKHELREFSFAQLETELGGAQAAPGLDGAPAERGLVRDGRFAFLP
ncbi:MAG: TetR/AcrR family transcriptional regulator, partial [Bauldia litoralis]